MSQIKGKDTIPEMIVRKFLFANGVRYRLHVKTLPGKPDIVIKKYNTIVDVRGCFWHGHAHCRFGVPTESIGVTERIRSAIKRDKKNEEQWKQLGWNVITVWDSCELEVKKKNSDVREKILNGILKKILEQK